MTGTIKARPISEIERQILDPGDVDRLGEMLLSLSREIWVLIDRMAVMEKILAENGLDISGQIDAYEPSPAFAAELAGRRKVLIGEMLRTMNTAIPEGVTHSAKFGD